MSKKDILAQKCRDALKQSTYWNNRTKESSDTISNLTCPVCGDGSAWAYSQKSYSINCNRLSNCGVRTPIIELLNIEWNIEKEHPPTRSDPKAPATAYLKSRGLNKVLQGLDYEFWPKTRKGCGGAVMFKVVTPDGAAAWNGRLFSPPKGEGKTHNRGSSSGAYFLHPADSAESVAEKNIYISEGIINSLSICEMTGEPGVAVLSAGQDPEKVPLPRSLVKNLILSFDNDPAGIKATKIWKNYYPDAKVILPDRGSDWNDILRLAKTEGDAKALFHCSLPKFEFNGRLALSTTPGEYSKEFFSYHCRPAGIFTFRGKTYFASMCRGGKEDVKVERLLSATCRLLAIFKNTSDPDRPINNFHLEIKPLGKPPICALAGGRDLSTPRSLKEFFLSSAGISFDGATQATTAFTRDITGQSAPEVEQLEITGYQATGFYIFPFWGVDTAGNIIYPNEKGYFRIRHNHYCRAATHEMHAIEPCRSAPPVKEILQLLLEAFGDRGATGFAWFVASLFVTRIKEKENFFPFCSFYGETASGKSALTTLLNNFLGVDSEGLPITSLNSKKGISRSIGRTSLPTALLEDNRRDISTFDYSIVLTGFNRGPLQIQAAYSGDNKTVEKPFLGSLLFVQNTEPFASQAEKERVISLKFEKEDISTTNSRQAYDQLLRIPKKQRAAIIQKILSKRRFFEEGWFAVFNLARGDMDTIRHQRIRDNHALILGWHRLICKCFDIEYELLPYLSKRAEEKVISSQQTPYSHADKFFESLDNLDANTPALAACCHLHPEKKELIINYPGVEVLLKESGVFLDRETMSQLQAHPAFIASSRVFRFPKDTEIGEDGRPKSRRCWVFDAEKI